jgi:hypothetical protein
MGFLLLGYDQGVMSGIMYVSACAHDDQGQVLKIVVVAPPTNSERTLTHLRRRSRA